VLLGALVYLPTVSPALSPQSLALSTFRLAQGNTPLLALGDKVALLFGIAQDPISGYLFPKALQ
jgi:hypothetical protein